MGSQSSDSEDSYYSDSEEDYDGEENDHDDHESDAAPPGDAGESSQAQRGILISFPNLEMHGIELLEVFSISIEIKCERCKTQTDIRNVKNNVKIESAAVRAESCRKCANTMSIGRLLEIVSVSTSVADTRSSKVTGWI